MFCSLVCRSKHTMTCNKIACIHNNFIKIIIIVPSNYTEQAREGMT